MCLTSHLVLYFWRIENTMLTKALTSLSSLSILIYAFGWVPRHHLVFTLNKETDCLTIHTPLKKTVDDGLSCYQTQKELHHADTIWWVWRLLVGFYSNLDDYSHSVGILRPRAPLKYSWNSDGSSQWLIYVLAIRRFTLRMLAIPDFNTRNRFWFG